MSRRAAHPERIVPDETEPGIVALHLKRYDFARGYVTGKDVLDAACGVGYGTFHLAQAARRVVGVDRSAEAIAYASRRYAAPNVEFTTGDLLSLDLPDASFDVVCAFEAIEHLPDPDAFLAEAARVLRPGGVFLASTPRAEHTVGAPENPFHTVELSRDDFERMLRGRFAHVEVFGQRRLQTTRHRLAQRLDVLGLRRNLPALRRLARPLLGTAPMADVTLEEIEISRAALADATELIALCRLPAENAGAFSADGS